MMGSGLKALFSPKSYVIVGASQNFSRAGGVPVQNFLKAAPYRARCYLVNPKYDSIEGLPCYPSLRDLPEVPDLAILAVPAHATVDAVRLCSQLGVKAGVLFASGFSEDTSGAGASMQSELVAMARAAGMILVGPNCLGFINFTESLYATFLPVPSEPTRHGALSVVAQSGNVAATLWRAGRRAQLGFAQLVTTGNEATTELAEYLEYFSNEDETQCVLAYIEQLREGARFLRVATRLRDQGKALFLLKAGTSASGAAATASHTAAMSGDGVAYETAFRQVGAVCATDPTRLMDLARVWDSGARPSDSSICVVSVSGAGCALLADLFDRCGLLLPTLSKQTQMALKSAVPSYGMVTNPIDITGQVTNDPESMSAVVQALLADNAVQTIVFYVMGDLLTRIAPLLTDAAARRGKLVVVIDSVNGAAPSELLTTAKIPVFDDMDRSVSAIAGFLQWRSMQAAPMRWIPLAAERQAAAIDAPEIFAARAEGRRLLTEVEAKTVLRRLGLAMVDELAASTPDQAVTAAESLGFPVAIKVLSPDIAHKSDVGGVILAINGASEARDAFRTVVEKSRTAVPTASITGVVVQPMVSSGVQMLVGVIRDPVFGPVMSVAAGGVMTELYQDVARRLLPVNETLAASMLQELKAMRLLTGFRRSEPADIDALCAFIAQVSSAFLELGSEVEELEINPVSVLPKSRAGARGRTVEALDALITLSS